MLEFDPFRDTQGPDPYPLYRRLRDEAPVHHSPSADVHCVSRHEDVVAVLRDHGAFSSSAMQSVLMSADVGPLGPRSLLMLARFFWKVRTSPFRLQRAGSLVSTDPPRHDTMRRIVARGFTPRRIASWEPRARAVVNEQLRGLGERPRFDVVRELAIPLPTTLIAELLGVEPERRDDFKRWSDAIISVVSGSARHDPVESGLLEGFGDLFGYLRGVVRRRRREPGDDLVSLLVDPRQEGVLDELGIVQFVVLLLVAGNETTTNLIGNAVHALLDRPDALERAVSEPGRIPALVEEALRFDSPIQVLFREATRDVEIAGRRIPKGATVAPLLGSANRDERRYPEPDRFDLERDTSGHVAFGFGVHFCLGAALARLEARVALEALLPELHRFKRAGPAAPLIDSFVVRGRSSLELEAV
ncbi:MAG: cytochrome P450 [Myxococcota bacterium]